MNTTPAEPSAHAKGRILFVEEDPVLRERLQHALGEAGYVIVEAADFDGDYNEGAAPDLLLLDLDLQSSSAWDRYAEWKARFPKLCTVAFTSVPNRFGVARDVGINALMEKPVEPSLLLLVTASVIEECNRSGAQRAADSRPDFRYLTRAD
ncbi:MAG: Response regulator receiver domain, partial [Verrucomicrobiota bacterium]